MRCRRQHCDSTTVEVGEDAFYEVLPSGDGTIGLEPRFTFASSTAGSFPAVVRFQETEVGRIQVGQLLAVVQLCTGVLQLLVLPAPQLAAVTSLVSRLGWNS